MGGRHDNKKTKNSELIEEALQYATVQFRTRLCIRPVFEMMHKEHMFLHTKKLDLVFPLGHTINLKRLTYL
jgi:hypothetical protein